MPNPDRRSDPFPLCPEEVNFLRNDLRLNQVESHAFSPNGTFRLVERGSVALGHIILGWSPDLLGLRPEGFKLKTSLYAGYLRLYAIPGSSLVKVINPDQVRKVDRILSGVRIVSENGYLIEENEGDIDRLDWILKSAELGVTPPFFEKDGVYFKVDAELAGQRVEQLVFQHLSGPCWFKDGVVLDQNHRLVKKEIYHSLSGYRWNLEKADQAMVSSEGH